MFDLHVHAAPDIGPRIGDDLDVVRRYAEAGYAGCVLKGHYASTVGRALATGRSTGLAVFGGLALNRHVGGVNPAAVTAELLQGARVIWMPTADAHTQRTANLRDSLTNGQRSGTSSTPFRRSPGRTRAQRARWSSSSPSSTPSWPRDT